jgi:hypothetical protein
MKFVTLSALAAISLLAGCAASTAENTDQGQDDVTASSKLELASTSDSSSIQAKLYSLLDTFKGEGHLDISTNGASITMNGAREHGAPARSITCTKSSLVHATVGQGVTVTPFFACTLTGFNKVRTGVELPSVDAPLQGEEPLANNLFTLLNKGEQMGGGFGITRSGGVTPPCCDMPTSTTLAISDKSSTLSCTNRTGGFAFRVFTECSLLAKDANDEVEVQKGTLLEAGVAIGGEGTGFNAQIGNKKLELVLSDADKKAFVVGRVARITGSPTTLDGVETHNRPAIKVANLLVCPAPHTTLSMMPPVSDDGAWLGKNCPDLDIVE